MLLGWSHLRAGETGAALEALEAALRLDPRSPAATYLYAQALYAAGATDEAAEFETRAADLGYR
jgi:cytochrome c-type biogenesis protein CcmH/NrfG